jgi:hypothetical protein
MLEIHRALTPAEFYVWAWLCQAGGGLITIKRSSCEFYTREHLKTILRSLQSKKFLVIVTSPKNQHQDLVVSLRSDHRLKIFLEADQGKSWGGGLNEPLKVSAPKKIFKQDAPEYYSQPASMENGQRFILGQLGSASASARKEDLKAWLEEGDQQRLLLMVHQAAVKDREALGLELAKLSPMARGKVSRTAVIYAALRFLQNGESAKNPGAWVQGVAMKADKLLAQLVLKKSAIENPAEEGRAYARRKKS